MFIVPAQPLNVTGKALSDSTINVTWVNNPAGPNLTVLGYTVFYKPYIEVNAPWLRHATGVSVKHLTQTLIIKIFLVMNIHRNKYIR